MKPVGRVIGSVVVSVLRAYQRLISPWLPASCRFAPTCSEYAVGAIQEFGILRGSYFAAKRITKCHPWHPGGLDPVPRRH